MMTSEFDRTDLKDMDENRKTASAPSKSQVKRECHQLQDLGDEIIKLSSDDLNSLELPGDLREAILIAHKIKSRSGLKRQRQYIGKLLRGYDSEAIASQLQKIRHRHDTNTAQFKRLEQWRNKLVDNDKAVLDEIIERFPDIDRQHINQLIRAAQQENQHDKPPAASRKLFKYLRELEESLG